MSRIIRRIGVILCFFFCHYKWNDGFWNFTFVTYLCFKTWYLTNAWKFFQIKRFGTACKFYSVLIKSAFFFKFFGEGQSFQILHSVLYKWYMMPLVYFTLEHICELFHQNRASITKKYKTSAAKYDRSTFWLLVRSNMCAETVRVLCVSFMVSHVTPLDQLLSSHRACPGDDGSVLNAASVNIAGHL